ncbi:hypothetical protein GCM10028862_02970 [Luteimonas pelagia]
MEPALSQVYEAVLRLEELAGVRLSFRDDLREGASDGCKHYAADLKDFNRLVSDASSQPLDLGQTLALLGKIRLLSLALEDEFRGVSDAIQKAASEVTRHGA